MAKLNVSKELVSNIASQSNLKFINSTNKFVSFIVGSTIKDLSEKVSLITKDNVILQPANELLSGAFIDGSSFVYLLGIKNAQLEINTGRKPTIWQSFKERLKYAWENRKRVIKKKKKRRKKDEEIQLTENNTKFDPSKYTVNQLAEDIQKYIIRYLSETSLVYVKDNVIQIIGKDDFGSNTKIVLYVVNYDGENYKYYSKSKKDFIRINIDSRYNALKDKIKAAGDNFIKILKIMNTLYFNVNGDMANQVFMESVLCAIPNDLFQGDDIYKVFIKILNYITIKSLKDVKSINNLNETIFKDDVCGNTGLGFNKMISKVFAHE